MRPRRSLDALQTLLSGIPAPDGPNFGVADDGTVNMIGEAPPAAAISLALLESEAADKHITIIDGCFDLAGLVRYRPLWVDHGCRLVYCLRSDLEIVDATELSVVMNVDATRIYAGMGRIRRRGL